MRRSVRRNCSTCRTLRRSYRQGAIPLIRGPTPHPQGAKREMTNDERDRKQLEEKLRRLTQHAEAANPEEMNRKIAEYENTPATVASTSATDATPDPLRPDASGERNASRPLTTKTNPEIEAAMEAAEDIDAVVEALSHERWARKHDGNMCPKHGIATVAELVEILPNSPLKTITKTCELLSQVYDGAPAKWGVYYPLVRHLGAAVETVTKDRRTVALLQDPLEVHRKFMAMPRKSRPLHPLAPLLEFYWQESFPRPAGRFPEGTPFNPRKRGSLVRFSVLSDQQTHLPGFPDPSTAPAEPAGRPPLPKFTDEFAAPGCTNWMLWLFDQAGGRRMSQGHGAPCELRLWIYAAPTVSADRDSSPVQWHKRCADSVDDLRA